MALAIENGLGWIFREQETTDVGIDAHAELVAGGEATGRLIALQIKSGKSYFTESDADGITFRGDAEHRAYWLDHSLPVVVVLVDEDGDCYWQAVTHATVESAGKGWKMQVPWEQKLDASSASALSSVATAGASYQQRLTRLILDLPFLERLSSGDELRLDVAEWIHKSSGRGSYRVLHVADDGQEEVLQEFNFIAPGWDYEDLLAHLFPWAAIRLDYDFYEPFEEDRHDEECGVWDQEEGCYMFHTEDYSEWRAALPEFRPYQNVQGEVDKYRFTLEMSDLGRSFLVVHGHLADQ